MEASESLTVTTLLVGYDAAWTRNNSGALAAVLHQDDGKYVDIGPPEVADYEHAENAIEQWQRSLKPTATLILLDQPTIVTNSSGQRPVEQIACSVISKCRGGMQPAHTGRADMFGSTAPVWPFLKRFGGAANPLSITAATCVYETYPALAMVALDWLLEDSRVNGRLPKYNPARPKTFSVEDWRHVCARALQEFARRGLTTVATWIDDARRNAAPRKADQDQLDACLCLLVAFHLAEQRLCLMLGDLQSGYIVVPHSCPMFAELEARCKRIGRQPSQWLTPFQVSPAALRCSEHTVDFATTELRTS